MPSSIGDFVPFLGEIRAADGWFGLYAAIIFNPEFQSFYSLPQNFSSVQMRFSRGRHGSSGRTNSAMYPMSGSE